jgi:hypothetical protein
VIVMPTGTVFSPILSCTFSLPENVSKIERISRRSSFGACEGSANVRMNVRKWDLTLPS